MTQTELLRARLDELGIEHADASYKRKTPITTWMNGDSTFCFVEEPSKHTDLHVEECTPEQAIAATVGKDIECYDGSGRRGTVAILQGGRKPEEVLFVCDEGGVTHYLQEDTETCKQEEFGWSTEGDHARVWLTCGHDCMVETVADLPKFCPECGAKVVAE